MFVTCKDCNLRFDDSVRSTLCPHTRFISEANRKQKDLAFSLVGKKLRFAHQVDDPNGEDVYIQSINQDGMVTLRGWSGEFTPTLFVEVKSA